MRKRVLLGVTGGIAAYKSAYIVSGLVKAGVDVVVVMTDGATKFVTPLTFETLSRNRVITDMFSRDFPYEVEHISLAKSSDLVLIAPATANFVGKIASGIADDMLTTTYMASKGIKVICPAMNEGMYTNEMYQKNANLLKGEGTIFVEPERGRLACGDEGTGRLREPCEIVDIVLSLLEIKPDYMGKNVLITAGATIESIDGVRYISNHSSGKMGVALAQAAAERGANVTLIAARVSVELPDYINTIRVVSTEDMYNAVMSELSNNDIIIKAAAPADYTVSEVSTNKIKSESLVLQLQKTRDIAKAVGEVKKDKILVIFSAETENLIDNAKGKIINKRADLVVANDVTKEGAGFDTDTNIVSIIDSKGKVEDYEIMPKYKLAHIILDRIIKL